MRLIPVVDGRPRHVHAPAARLRHATVTVESTPAAATDSGRRVERGEATARRLVRAVLRGRARAATRCSRRSSATIATTTSCRTRSAPSTSPPSRALQCNAISTRSARSTRSSLAAADRISYDIFLSERLRSSARRIAFRCELLPINQAGSLLTLMPSLGFGHECAAVCHGRRITSAGSARLDGLGRLDGPGDRQHARRRAPPASCSRDRSWRKCCRSSTR